MKHTFKLFTLSLLLATWIVVPATAQQYPSPQYNAAYSGAYDPTYSNAPYQAVGPSSPMGATMYDPLASPYAQPYGQPYAQQMGGQQMEGMYAQGYPSNAYPYPQTGQQACSSCEDDCGLFPSSVKHCGQFFLCGWLDQGYTYNAGSQKPQVNGPLKFNDQSDYMLNQLYLSVGRSVKSSGCHFDLGGRVDFLYGTDYLWTSALGLETRTTREVFGFPYYVNDPTIADAHWNSNAGNRFIDPLTGQSYLAKYGIALPQFYGEVNLPVGCGLNAKVGHFYSVMGYESVMSPQNFFYSRSYTMMYGEPMTYTGVLLNQRLNNRLSAIFGVVRGWDKWEDPNDKLSYLTGFQWKSCDNRTNISFVLGTGNESLGTDFTPGRNPEPVPVSQSGATTTHYSLVLSRQVTDRLKYVVQHDLGDGNFGVSTGNHSWHGHWYSINQYLFYQLTQTLEFGVRGEWFRDSNNTRVLIIGAGETDYSQITLGLNWKPCCWMNVRPEARWDWAGLPAYNNFSSKNQFTAAISTVVMF